MDKYVRPEMDVELFRTEIITASGVGCAAEDDELIGVSIGDSSF